MWGVLICYNVTNKTRKNCQLVSGLFGVTLSADSLSTYPPSNLQQRVCLSSLSLGHHILSLVFWAQPQTSDINSHWKSESQSRLSLLSLRRFQIVSIQRIENIPNFPGSYISLFTFYSF